MRSEFYRRFRRIIFPLLALVLSACGGGGPKHGLDAPDQAFGVPWPPPVVAGKHVSDDVVRLNGLGYTAVGGQTDHVGTVVNLHGGGVLTWAMYVVNEFSAAIHPGQFEVDFSITPTAPGDGTALWIGLADYSKGRWSWEQAAPPTYTNTPSEPLHFQSPANVAALAAVITGPGSATITEVRFHRVGDTDPPIPQNLTGTAEIGVAHLDWDDVPGVTGYHVYRSLASDFSSPVQLTTVPVVPSQYDDTTVGSDTDYYYKVTSFKISESQMSNIALVHAPEETLGIPQNLRATPFVGQIQLDWDPVAGATGYNIYRDVSWDWSAPVKLNAAPVPDPSFLDDQVAMRRIYYYRVSATHITESGLSDMVDIFVPQVDLPEPENPRAIDISYDRFRTMWDWSVANPDGGFVVYVSTIPNFSLDDEPELRSQSMPSGRSLLWTGRTEETTYYFRIAARSGGQYGRMTDDLPVITKGYWNWDTLEDIGPGGIPLVMVEDGGDLTAAYHNGNNIDVARRNAGTWTVEPGVLSTADDPGGFALYIDLAASNGNYVMAGYAVEPDDLWAATGGPGAWTTGRVDGNGDAGIGHQTSGEYCTVAASAGEYALLYMDAPLNSLMLRTHPVGPGSWSAADTMRGGVTVPLFHSTAYDGTNLFVLMMDTANTQLLLGDRDGAWSFSDIANSGGETLGSYNELVKIGADWWTPAVNDTTGDFYTLRGSGATWEMKTVSTIGVPGDPVGANSRLVPYGANVAMVYFDYNGGEWYLGIYDTAAGTWSSEIMHLNGNPGFSVDLAVLGTDPYIMYFDTTDNHVKCYKGLPPA